MSRPVRTCTGCRERGDKSELLRLVVCDGAVVVDEAHRLPGRGAYLHRNGACLDRALRRRTIGRALRIAPDARQLEAALRPSLGELA